MSKKKMPEVGAMSRIIGAKYYECSKCGRRYGDEYSVARCCNDAWHMKEERTQEGFLGPITITVIFRRKGVVPRD